MKIPWDEMGWDGMTFKSHGMGWDENFLKLVPWDAMGRMKKICPMGRISRPIPSHSEL